MSRFSNLVPAGLLACTALAGCRSTDDTQEASIRSADAQAMEATAPQEGLPPGMTEEDMKMMQQCIEAGTPGEMHAFLAQGAGTWQGENTMWMMPGAEPMKTTCKADVEAIMDGRYVKYEYSGEMPGMGTFNGMALYGFDNVSKKFACTWIDSMSTGLMNGTGDLSADKKTLTWTFTYNDPITKKPATMREIERITGDNTRTLDMFGKDPKSGVEYQMMHMEFTRRSN